MGTRHLTCVVKDGEFKVAQYGQWDGYPEGQGSTILEFLATMDREKFEAALDNCRFITNEEIGKKWEEVGVAGKFADLDQSKAFEEKYPQLHRDIGADVLALIQESSGLELGDDHEFAADSLFCEFAYVLDMDNNVLEMYTGFNEKPVEGRFKDIVNPDDTSHRRYKYYPVNLVASYPFDNLPTVEEMNQVAYPDEEEAVA